MDHSTVVPETETISPSSFSRSLQWLVPVAAGLITLLPPWIIGTSSSALTLQSLEHWLAGSPDRFEALHIHWLWIPRVIAFITGDAFSALVIFRALLVGCAAFLFQQTLNRLFDNKRALFGVAMLVCNITILYFLHTFASQLLTMTMASLLLYLLTSENPIHHRIAAVLFGLSLSIGFWPFVLLLSVMTVGLNIHHRTYRPRAKQTYILLALVLLGAASYLILEIFYFGSSHLWEAMNPWSYPMRWTSLIAEGLIVAIVSSNVLLASIFRRKPGGLGRDFQAAFVIVGVFFILNTFQREQLLHDAVILVPMLIIAALDRFANVRRFAVIYLAVNLAAFFLLPTLRLDPQYALANTKRTKPNDEIAFSYYDAEDVLTYAKVRDEKLIEDEASQLLRSQRLDSTLVLINPATDGWFDAATLGAQFQQATFGWFYGNPINMVRRNGLIDTAFIRPPASRPYLAGLFEKSFARTSLDSGLAPGTPTKESERLQFVSTRGNDAERRSLIDQLIYLQYESLHHH